MTAVWSFYRECNVCRHLADDCVSGICKTCRDAYHKRISDLDLDALIAGRMGDVGADEEVGS